MSEVILEAAEENLGEVLQFVEEALENAGCSLEDQRRIAIAVEEVFVNIVSYAYKPGRRNIRNRRSVESRWITNGSFSWDRSGVRRIFPANISPGEACRALMFNIQ